MPRDLDALFRPRSVAVIGASRNRGAISGEVFHNLVRRVFHGPVYPVNPAAESVQSVKAYASVEDIEGPVDLAIVVVPRDLVEPVVRSCANKGVKGLVVITAGFAEVGEQGRELQRELVELVRGHGMRMLGPNCLGLLNTDPAIQLDATFAPTWPPEGSVSIASQSGAVGLALLDYARDLGIGIRMFASLGNKADVSGNDLLEYWETDPATRVILLYMESLGNPVRFVRIARRVSRHKPIVAVKSGRTAAGARAAASHTGSLAGMDVAVDALLGQAGVLRVDSIAELFDLSVLLANQPVPAGRRVAILTNAGGPGIMATDACESHGLRVSALSERGRRALQGFLPSAASVQNPVDMLASASAEHYERALRVLMNEEDVDAVVVLFVPPVVTDAEEVARAIACVARDAAKPLLACFMGTYGVPRAVDSLREAKVPVYAFPEQAVLALARAVRYGEWLQRPEGESPVFTDLDPARARRVLEAQGEGWLPPEAVRELLEAYGLRMPRAEVATDRQAAIDAAERIGYPVAVKLHSDRIVHKTEVGGVRLGLRSAEEVGEAFDAIAEALRERGQLDAMQGVLVQEMVPGGVETYLGSTYTEGFGMVVGFGIGGVHVELWKDVVFRVHPLTDVDAREMLDQIRGRALLDGFRGEPPADREALCEAILRLDRMVGEQPRILELDLNPLVALPPGQGVVALDARVRVGERGRRRPRRGV